MDRKTFFTFAGLILLAAASRVLPHPHNFAPIGGMALFSAAYFRNNKAGFLLPLVALFLSDLYINNITYAAFYDRFVWISPGFYWVYGSFGLIALLGFAVFSRISAGRVIGAAIGSSVLFFLVTNFGAWAGSSLYPQNIQGLMMSYVAGIPFFWNTLAGDLVYSGVLFTAAFWVRSESQSGVPA